MSVYGPKDLEAAFRTVRKNTITIAEEIPADKYSFKAAPSVKSVAEMLAHVAGSTGWQVDFHGAQRTASVDFSKFAEAMAKAQTAEQELARSSKDDILKALRDSGEQFGSFLGGLSQDVLDENVSFPVPVVPSSKTRLEMLMSAKEHEMHHRGQLMLIERLLGIVPHLTREREARMAQMSATTR
jgi:uncharacterized damage-inducible protein DinB